MRTMSKGLGVAVITMALLAVMVGPVFALVTKQGSVYCPQTKTAYTHSYSTGNTDHYLPGGAHGIYADGGTWTYHTKYDLAPGTGGTWRVTVSGGSLNDPQTYAGCY